MKRALAQYSTNCATEPMGAVYEEPLYMRTGDTCHQHIIDNSAKGGLTQFWELFTMIPCAPKYLER